VCNEIAHVALDLFLKGGFDATTIDDIVLAAGVGRRTFFRYFETKEAIVLLPSANFGATVAELIAERPRTEAPIRALEAAFQAALEIYIQNPQRMRELYELVDGHPMLRARHLAQQDEQAPLFAAALAARMRAKAGALAPELIARVGLVAFRMAMALWARDPKADLAKTLGATFAALEETLPLSKRK